MPIYVSNMTCMLALCAYLRAELYGIRDVIMGSMTSQITSLTIVFLKRLFWRRSKKTSKLSVTGLCAGN